MCCLVLLLVWRWAHNRPHIAALNKNYCIFFLETFLTLSIFKKRKWQGKKKKEEKNAFISKLAYIAVQKSHLLMRQNASQLAISVYLPISQGCVCLHFVCRVLPGDILVCSCCWNSSPGLCLFLSSNKGNSGVLTFIQSEGRLAYKTLWCTVCK